MQNNKLHFAATWLKKDYMRPLGITLLALIAVLVIAVVSFDGNETQTAKKAASKQTNSVAKSEKNTNKSGNSSDTARVKKIEPVTELRKATISTRSGPPTKRLSSR